MSEPTDRNNAAAGAASSMPPPDGSGHLVARVVVRGASEMVLAAVDGLNHVAEDCAPDLKRHVNDLAEDLAGVTVDWIARWPS